MDLIFLYLTGKTVYATFVREDGQYFNAGSGAPEAYDNGHWTAYAVPLAAVGANAYTLTVPSALPAGNWTASYFEQLGAQPATSDPFTYASDTLAGWNGTAVTPPPAVGTATSYLDASSARALAAALPASWFAQLLALSDDQLGAVLRQATADIDHPGFRYQGCKFDQAGAQTLEFPRLPYPDWNFGGAAPAVSRWPFVNPLTTAGVIWDWDQSLQTAVVPPTVRLATLHQAAWALNPANLERREAIVAGVASSAIGSGSENYVANAAALGSGLGERALRLMTGYRLRAGSLL